jgi:hypothetical protein
MQDGDLFGGGIAFPELVSSGWAAYGDRRGITSIREVSANVSTNHVYLVQLEDMSEVVAKTSSYGSYVHFRQDHRIIQQWIRRLGGTRFRKFLAACLEKDGEVFTHRDGNFWVVFYEKAPFYDFLPKILDEPQILSLAREMAEFHLASSNAAPGLLPSWNSLGSDVASLYDALGNPAWRAVRNFSDELETTLREQCETFLTNAERLGYHSMRKVPILVDWNIGNFSVGLEQNGFRFFTRWDYDWFRVEPRTLDFYFCARVVRAEGDQDSFSYTLGPLLEDRFLKFLRAYHQRLPLSQEEVLFIKESYRVFLLNYVVRSGEHFFQEDICRRLQREAVEEYFPALDRTDFSPLLAAIR